MREPPPDRASNDRPSPEFWVAFAGSALLCAHLLIYRGEPMGRFPVMDGFYNLEMARQMAAGVLPEEPFFRAPVYPFLLSIPLRLGMPEAWLPDWARLLNLLAFIGTLTGLLVLQRRSGLRPGFRAIGMGAFALNPVVHFYAGDPYDILLCCALMVAFLIAAWPAMEDPRDRRAVALAGLVLALAFSLRSHFLPLACLWPGALLIRDFTVSRRLHPAMLLTLLLTVAPMLSALAITGWAQARVTGAGHVQAWQGPYMLYVTNHPDTTSAPLYRQVVDVSRTDSGRFPVEEEARRLYERLTGEPFSVDKANAFYGDGFLQVLREDPAHWMKLNLLRLYALLNNTEQYDNKTWELQQDLAPLLRWNPLGWGILLVAAALGFIPLAYRLPRFGWTLVLAAAGYSVVIVLVLANGRYRLPLIPILALAAAWAPVGWRQLGRKVNAWRALLGFAAALVTFSGIAGIRGPDTRVADYVLMAHAAQQAGEAGTAWRWIEEAAAVHPYRPDIVELRLSGAFNLALEGDAGQVPWPALARAGALLLGVSTPAERPDIRFLAAYAAYRAGDDRRARFWWTREPATASSRAAAALVFGAPDPSSGTTGPAPGLTDVIRGAMGSPRSDWPPALQALFPRSIAETGDVAR